MLPPWRTRIAVMIGCLAAYVSGVLVFSPDRNTAESALIGPIAGLRLIPPIWYLSMGVVAIIIGVVTLYLLRPSRLSLGLMLFGYFLWYWWGQGVFEAIASC